MRIHALGNDALIVQLAVGLEQGLPVAFMVLAVDDGLLELVGLDQLFQQLLTRELGEFAEVLAVEPQQIKSEVNEAVLVAPAEVCLQL